MPAVAGALTQKYVAVIPVLVDHICGQTLWIAERCCVRGTVPGTQAVAFARLTAGSTSEPEYQPHALVTASFDISGSRSRGSAAAECACFGKP